ncbi:MAG: hypothetical protein IKP07_04200 [Bacilli bacterium]|nr:hypothetical protein [Bacilli bacterium]
MIKIKTPVIGYNGIDCGVRFENGEATVETLLPHVLAYFRVHGYIVEEDEVQEVQVVEEETPEADNTDNGESNPEENNDAGEPEVPETGEEKSKAELLEEAKALGIENIRSKATKDEIIQLINDKKVELEALADNGNSDNENPEAGEAGDEDPEKGE